MLINTLETKYKKIKAYILKNNTNNEYIRGKLTLKYPDYLTSSGRLKEPVILGILGELTIGPCVVELRGYVWYDN